MSKIISFQEEVIKRELLKAREELTHLRTLIAAGVHDKVRHAESLELYIEHLEEDLVYMVENGIL